MKKTCHAKIRRIFLLLLFPFLFQFLFLLTPSIADQDFWRLPGDINPKTIRSYQVENTNIVVEEVYYQAGVYNDKPIRIFSYFCYPKYKKNLPAIILVHGGAGYADKTRAITWAKRGYVALSMDLPGKGQGRGISRSSGPDMDVEVLLRVKPNLYANYLYHAVNAVRCGITFLEKKEIVDKKNIGMVGLSWGGVITLLVNGIDGRLKTAVPVFGSGYLDDGSTWQEWFDSLMTREDLDIYNKNFDARNFIKSQHAPVFYLTGTNDNCFYLPNFIRTYNRMSGEKVLAIFPNVRHRLNYAMLRSIYQWCDYKLKNKVSFPSLKVGELIEKQGVMELPINIVSEKPVKVKIYYSQSDLQGWTEKYWKSILVEKKEGVFVGKIPKSIIKPEILYYISVENSRGAVVTSPVYALMRFKVDGKEQMFVRTEPIEKIFVHTFSRDTWGKLFKSTPAEYVFKIPLYHLWKIGARLNVGKEAFNLRLPDNYKTMISVEKNSAN